MKKIFYTFNLFAHAAIIACNNGACSNPLKVDPESVLRYAKSIGRTDSVVLEQNIAEENQTIAQQAEIIEKTDKKVRVAKTEEEQANLAARKAQAAYQKAKTELQNSLNKKSKIANIICTADEKQKTAENIMEKIDTKLLPRNKIVIQAIKNIKSETSKLIKLCIDEELFFFSKHKLRGSKYIQDEDKVSKIKENAEESAIGAKENNIAKAIKASNQAISSLKLFEQEVVSKRESLLKQAEEKERIIEKSAKVLEQEVALVKETRN